MNNTLINPNFTNTSPPGIGLERDQQPVELYPHSSTEEKEVVIRSIYRQVLGNAHLMESDRLTVAESQLKQGNISVREFVRTLAKSELYKSHFIDNCPRYRSHELNFKHLLGRAPDGYPETLSHSQTLDRQGYAADIDSYIDSDEYQTVFGENIVPYYRGNQTQTGQKLLGYTNMFKMVSSSSTSDKAGLSGNAPRLLKPLIYNNATGTVPVTDVKELLQELFQKTKTSTPVSSGQFIPYNPQPQPESPSLKQEIAELETQLAQLRSFATIGAAGVNKWQAYYTELNQTPSSSNNSYSNQTKSSPTQLERLETLKQEIAQAKSLASLGEARLNKWRSRVFSG